jgi:hypothetical protein
MTNLTKYPRTMHLPWSPGLQNDDRVIESLEHLEGQEIVVTEKMDGENCSIYKNDIHARSIDGRYHPSRDWVKQFAAQFNFRLGDNDRICGENMYARHSIEYNDLETYFYGFGFWNNNICLDWDATVNLFVLLDITAVPVLYRGTFDEKVLRDLGDNMDFDKQEGYVVRVTSELTMPQFPYTVAKFVRPGHVQTDSHWMHAEIKPNGLKT